LAVRRPLGGKRRRALLPKKKGPIGGEKTEGDRDEALSTVGRDRF